MDFVTEYCRITGDSCDVTSSDLLTAVFLRLLFVNETWAEVTSSRNITGSLGSHLIWQLRLFVVLVYLGLGWMNPPNNVWIYCLDLTVHSVLELLLNN